MKGFTRCDAESALNANRKLQERVAIQLADKGNTLARCCAMLQCISPFNSWPCEQDESCSPGLKYQGFASRSLLHDPFAVSFHSRPLRTASPEKNADCTTFETSNVMFPHPSMPVGQLVWTSVLDELLTYAVMVVRKRREHTTAKCENNITFKATGCSNEMVFGLLRAEWSEIADLINATLECPDASRVGGSGPTTRRLSAMDCMLRYGNVCSCSRDVFSAAEDALILRYVEGEDGKHLERVASSADQFTGRPRQNFSCASWSELSNMIAARFSLQRSVFSLAQRYQAVLRSEFCMDTSVSSHVESMLRSAVLQAGTFDIGCVILHANQHFPCCSSGAPQRWLPYSALTRQLVRRMAKHVDDDMKLFVRQESAQQRRTQYALGSVIAAAMIFLALRFVDPQHRSHGEAFSFLQELQRGDLNRIGVLVDIINNDLSVADEASLKRTVLHTFVAPTACANTAAAVAAVNHGRLVAVEQASSALLSIDKVADALGTTPTKLADRIASCFHETCRAGNTATAPSTVSLKIFGRREYSGLCKKAITASLIRTEVYRCVAKYPTRCVALPVRNSKRALLSSVAAPEPKKEVDDDEFSFGS